MSGAPNGLEVEAPIATKPATQRRGVRPQLEPKESPPTLLARNLSYQNVFIGLLPVESPRRAKLSAGVLREGGDFDASKPGAGYDAHRFTKQPTTTKQPEGESQDSNNDVNHSGNT